MKLRVDGGFGSGVENDIRMAQRVEAFLLHGNGVGAEREIRKDVVAVVPRFG